MTLNTNLGQVDIYIGKCVDLTIDRNSKDACVELSIDCKIVSDNLRKQLDGMLLHEMQRIFDANKTEYHSMGCDSLDELIEKYNIAERYSWIRIYVCGGKFAAEITVSGANGNIDDYIEGDIMEYDVSLNVDLSGDIATVEKFILDMVRDNFIEVRKEAA